MDWKHELKHQRCWRDICDTAYVTLFTSEVYNSTLRIFQDVAFTYFNKNDNAYGNFYLFSVGMKSRLNVNCPANDVSQH